MSKIKLSLVLNTRITLFLREGLKNHERKALITISPLLPANHKITLVCFGIASAVSMTFCMLRHRKIGMSNIIRYFFSLSNMPMRDMFKIKICKEKSKSKDQKCFKNDYKCVF